MVALGWSHYALGWSRYEGRAIIEVGDPLINNVEPLHESGNELPAGRSKLAQEWFQSVCDAGGKEAFGLAPRSLPHWIESRSVPPTRGADHSAPQVCCARDGVARQYVARRQGSRWPAAGWVTAA
jgi:hypothetical protein